MATPLLRSGAISDLEKEKREWQLIIYDPLVVFMSEMVNSENQWKT